MTTTAATNASRSARLSLPAPLQVQFLLNAWMLDRAGYDLASRPTVDLAFDALLPKGQRKWIGSHETRPAKPPAPRGGDRTAYGRELAQCALEVAYVVSGAPDAELVATCKAMCAKGAVSWTEMAERILNCAALLWRDSKINPAVRTAMTKALDAFIEDADGVVARLIAAGETSQLPPREWAACRRIGASKVHPRDGRGFPDFFARALSTLSCD